MRELQEQADAEALKLKSEFESEKMRLERVSQARLQNRFGSKSISQYQELLGELECENTKLQLQLESEKSELQSQIDRQRKEYEAKLNIAREEMQRQLSLSSGGKELVQEFVDTEKTELQNKPEPAERERELHTQEHAHEHEKHIQDIEQSTELTFLFAMGLYLLLKFLKGRAYY